MRKLIQFIQLNEENNTEVRYAFIGFHNEDNTISGLVYGYEGGGEYSDDIITHNKYIQDELFDEYLEFDDKVEIFNEIQGKVEFEKLQNIFFSEMLVYNKETGETHIHADKMADNQLTFINEFGYSLGEAFIPPSYANTFWDDDYTSVMTEEEIKASAPDFFKEYMLSVEPS